MDSDISHHKFGPKQSLLHPHDFGNLDCSFRSARFTYTLAVFNAGELWVVGCEICSVDGSFNRALETSPVEPLSNYHIVFENFGCRQYRDSNSLETIAAWDVKPPRLVIIPAALRMAGTKSGVVISVTNIAFLDLAQSLTSGTILWSRDHTRRSRGATNCFPILYYFVTLQLCHFT